jgi:N-sulfoglucosamine sulfohydrolase
MIPSLMTAINLSADMCNTLSLRLFASMAATCLFTSVLECSGQESLQVERSRPNLLVVIADDWSYGHASIYGCKWVKTPTFDRMCREGVSFSHCFTSNPKCFPSRASILSGRNTWQLGPAANHFGKYTSEYPNYVDILEDSGYFVGFTGKGCRPGQTIGFNHSDAAGKEFKKHELKPPHSGLSKLDYLANFNSFLKARPAERPFCFWLGISEPHRRYELGSGERSGKNIADVTLPAYYPQDDKIKSDVLDYAVEVEWFDKQFGLVLAELEKNGELDNTFIVVTSDHGMPFPRIKGNVYEDAVHIPLAIRWGKNIVPGRLVDDFVNVRDLAPTFLHVAGLQPNPQMTGKSLAGILASDKSGSIETDRNQMLVGKERHSPGRPYGWGYPVRGIRTAQYLYKINYEPDRWPAGNPETGLSNCDKSPTKELLAQFTGKYYDMAFGKRPEEELFDLTQDPDCVHNLASDPEHTAVKKKLKKELVTALKQEGDPRVLGDPSVFIKPPSNKKYLKLKAEFSRAAK